MLEILTAVAWQSFATAKCQSNPGARHCSRGRVHGDGARPGRLFSHPHLWPEAGGGQEGSKRPALELRDEQGAYTEISEISTGPSSCSQGKDRLHPITNVQRFLRRAIILTILLARSLWHMYDKIRGHAHLLYQQLQHRAHGFHICYE